MAKECILLIEDNPDDVTLIARLLKKLDESIELVVAANGEAAMQLFMGNGRFSKRGGGQRPLVILLDLHLPRIGGFVLLEVLKQELKARRIPIVVISASKEEVEEVESLNLGASDFIQKPVTMDALKQLLGKHRRGLGSRVWR